MAISFAWSGLGGSIQGGILHIGKFNVILSNSLSVGYSAGAMAVAKDSLGVILLLHINGIVMGQNGLSQSGAFIITNVITTRARLAFLRRYNSS